MGKRSRGSSATTSNTMSSVPSSAFATTYGTIVDLEPGSPPETRPAASALVGPVPAGPMTTSGSKKSGRDGKNIWDEYYPLVQPAHQYHHRNDRGSSNYFFHGMFSADVMWAYRDAVIAYLVSLYSMVVLSLTGLVFCKQWGISPNTPIVFAFRGLWFVSPAIASLALRNTLEIVFSHSTILASAITGCIWALWHWPMIVADALDVVPKGSGYSVAETRDFHLLYVLAVFTLLLVGSRIIMCWIQGNSSYVIWSSVVYHSTHNLFITSVFGQLTAPLYEKAQLFSFFSSEASICLLVTVWFSTCILSQMFRWTNLMPMLRRANPSATRALAA
ncbi:hypothetical protein JG687_00016488 [Phytophthora cactorum]|uniref:Transmembrane protein n=1 Tax=Phytophthora cactorum TaxID=29920 RepID=A0A8T1TQK6_9STRA|nr:hypothetical protein JG687_00016488 [Phytophthora cactorum]